MGAFDGYARCAQPVIRPRPKIRPDDHDREMAKWAHDRLARERQEAEEEQCQGLADLDEMSCSHVKMTESVAVNTEDEDWDL